MNNPSPSNPYAEKNHRVASRKLGSKVLQTLLAGIAISGIVPGIAFAQEATEASADEPEIIVTGSRVVQDGTQAPTPVTVVSAEQLRLASPGPIGEALNQLPVFRGSTRPTTGSTSATGPNSGSFLNLRRLGPQRTLILLDGRRATPSALLGTTDTNLLPQELVSRVDIVTGGASAAYGSDAVSGVVNFALDTKYKGLKGEFQAGLSNYADNGSLKLSLTGGTDFADGRGHIVISGSYFDSEGVQNATKRPWGNEGRGTLNNPANPAMLLVGQRGIGYAVTSHGGVIVASPAGTGTANLLRGTQFLAGGVTAPFNFGTTVSGLSAIGGDGARMEPNLSADVTTKSLFTHVTYDLTPDVEIFVEGAWATAHNRYVQAQQFNIPGLNPLTIFSGNAFLPASIQATMTANSIPSFTLGRLSFDLGGPSTADAKNDTWSVVGGIKAKLGGSWTADAYFQHGQNTQKIRTERNPVHERVFAAVDAVRDGNNNIVCRVTLTNPGLYPGCVPINFFGVGSPSQASIDYIMGEASYDMVVKQDVFAANIRGEPFSTWAGPVAVGFGGEYRKISLVQTSDSISQSINDATGIRGFPAAYLNNLGGHLLTNPQPVSGSYNVKEGFIEVLVPLARDMPLLNSLDLNGAYRLTDYSTSGSVSTWKAGLSWSPFADLRFRGTRSRDIRAPNIGELYSGSVQLLATVLDRQNNNTATSVLTATQGNSQLNPETADTLTVGGVYKPAWLPGLSVSVDYYDIKVKGVIQSITAQQTMDQCAAGSAIACANVIRDGNGVLTRILLPQLNLASRKTSGIDFEAGYRTTFSDGDLSVRALVSNVRKDTLLVPGGVEIDRAGEVVLAGNPRWEGNFSVHLNKGPWGVFLQERYIGSGKYDNTRIEGVTINDNDVPAVFYTDAAVKYRINADDRKFEISFTVNNLFNKAPPLNASQCGLGVCFAASGILYDVLGRYFTLGARFAF